MVISPTVYVPTKALIDSWTVGNFISHHLLTSLKRMNAIVYIDNILIYSQYLSDHQSHMKLFFSVSGNIRYTSN